MSDRQQALLDAERAITARLAGYDPRKDRAAIAATIMAALVVRRLRTGETQTEIRPGFVVVPIDDPARDHADSLLPSEVIDAGALALERCDNDLDNYVAGVTPDWDYGMEAVAVYRAMIAAIAAARKPPQCPES